MKKNLLENLVKQIIAEQAMMDKTVFETGKAISRMLLKHPQQKERYQVIILSLLIGFKHFRHDVESSWDSLVDVAKNIMRGEHFQLNSQVLDQLLDFDIKNEFKESEEISFGSISINKKIHELKVGEKVYNKVPPKQFNLLYYLMSEPNIVKSKEDILNKVWPDNFDVPDSNIAITIIKLKQNYLGQKYSNCIQNVSKRGYRFVPPKR